MIVPSKTSGVEESMVQVDTNPYFRSHRKEPRGKGSWAFVERSKADRSGNHIDAADLIWLSGTFTEAKKSLPAGYWYVQP